MEYGALVGAVSGRGVAADFYALGCALYERRLWGAASGCFARAVAGLPEDARAWSNWGWCSHLAGESGLGAERLRRAVELDGGAGVPLALLCQVLTTLGELGEAVEVGRRAVELEPGVAVNHVGYAIGLLTAGEWDRGWREYEWRFEYKIPEFLSRPYRLWRGERVGHLYIEAEQGLGDTIFGLRWLGVAAEWADRVTFFVQKELYGLFEVPGNVSVYPMPRPLPVVDEVDAWCPVLSLPVALGGLGGLEGVVSGIRVPAVASREPGLFRVGLVWAGSPTHESAHHRDVPLAQLLRLAEVPGVELHSLQLGAGQGQLGELGGYGLIVDRSPELLSMSDTARVLSGLDLLVTVDTAVAHLAGSMGVPCWMLVNRRGMDFRWGGDGEGTAWYPSVRLFRRELAEETWGACARRVEVALRGLVG